MSILEIKLEIYELIAQIHDEKKIRRIYEAMQRIVKEERSENRGDLSVEQSAAAIEKTA